MKKLRQRTKAELEIIKSFLEDYDLWGDTEIYGIAKYTLQEQLKKQGGKTKWKTKRK